MILEAWKAKAAELKRQEESHQRYEEYRRSCFYAIAVAITITPSPALFLEEGCTFSEAKLFVPQRHLRCISNTNGTSTTSFTVNGFTC